MSVDAYRPNLPERMKQIVRPEDVQPHHWAKTYGWWGVTEEDVEAARTAEMERRLREPAEGIDE